MNLPAAFAKPRTAWQGQFSWLGLLICLALITALRFGQHLLPDTPPMSGLVLIVVIAALWTLPAKMAWAVVLLTILTSPIAFMIGDSGLSSVISQLTAICIVAPLAEITVRSLQTETRRQEATAKQLRQFAATAAHELRNPLTAVKSEVETTLRSPRDVETMTSAMQRVLHNTDRLIRVNDTLLTLARSDAGVLRVGDDEVDLADLVEEACSRWRAHALASGVELVANAEDPAKTRGDSILLSQLLDNLISNALRYAPFGTAVEVAVDYRVPAHGHHLLTVSDLGPGIDPELRDTVFEPFVTGEARGVKRGAGLGLALCAAVAAAHHATIELNPNRLSGTEVLVSLPATEKVAAN